MASSLGDQALAVTQITLFPSTPYSEVSSHWASEWRGHPKSSEALGGGELILGSCLRFISVFKNLSVMLAQVGRGYVPLHFPFHALSGVRDDVTQPSQQSRGRSQDRTRQGN